MIDCIEQQQQQSLRNPLFHTNQHEQHHHTHHYHSAHNQHQQVLMQQNPVERQTGNKQMLPMYHQQLVINPPPLIEPIPTLVPLQAAATTSNLLASNNDSSHQHSSNELIGYYFGSISRETAEWILKSHGNQTNGAYLLRSSGPNDDFVLSLMVVRDNQPSTTNQQTLINNNVASQTTFLEILHYKIVETEDSFVALHGQTGDEKFATIDELIDKAQGVATKPCWPIHRQILESQILPPTYWGLTVDQIRLAILLKAKQWGFPLLSSLFQQAPQQEQLVQSNLLLSMQHNHNHHNYEQQQQQLSLYNQLGSITENGQINSNITTLNNETIRTLIYKSLHEFQPWFHGKISREEAERRIEDGSLRDGKFLVRERDNYSYAMCISHKKTTKHYRIDVLSTGELAIQDGRKFTSLMALVSHYTIMSDGLWCALTEACPRPIQMTNFIRRNLNNNCSGTNTALKSNPSLQTAQIARNNCNIAMNQQNVYCIPPPCNNINNNAMTNNMPSSMPSNIKNLPENYKNDLQLNHNNSAGTHGSNNKLPQSHGLICTPQQASIASIKTPIKEWLQTINHKWSQLLASKNQHQTLNSFLFGNQNPLNNHCRHRNHQHHLSHRRKCKNGHTSCGCIQQIIANGGRAPTSAALNHGVGSCGVSNDIIGIQPLATRLRSHDITRAQSCCTSNLCQVANKDRSNSSISKNLILDSVTSNSDHSNNALLSSLPQNSGFTLNSQSFIGSPLFAVKHQAKLERKHKGNYSGSSSSDSGNSNNVGEEKLISPAQSLSADLNNPYNLNNDIYGSQTSTAIVNDRLQTSSSSSSGTVNMLQRGLNNNLDRSNILQRQETGIIKPIIKGEEIERNRSGVPLNQSKFFKQAGQILCGQHAGPAYRYTNCNDENSFKPCYHRPMTSYKTADDSLLLTPSTKLANSAAMAKFVQFQDGQCLRTHRDTKSIQMAYLSSRQDPNGNNKTLASSKSVGHSKQVPLRELNGFYHQQQGNNINTNLSYMLQNNQSNNFRNDRGNNFYPNNTPLSIIKESDLLQGGSIAQQNYPDRAANGNANDAHIFEDIDLMDCGEDGDHEFKYDPKLIKSSSIETLCGAGDDGQINNDLDKFRNNTELMMSLQSCWFSNQQPEANFLNQIPSNGHTSSGNGFAPSLESTVGRQDQTSMLSNLMSESGRVDKELIHMKKKHDLDELTTALLAELTASLKSHVKRYGF